MQDPTRPAAAPPGWYPDATDAQLLRYWDGLQWTEQVTPAAAAEPPAVAPTAPAGPLPAAGSQWAATATAAPPARAQPGTGKATAALVLGLVGLIAWALPLAGFPVTIVGLIMGIKGRASTARGRAIAGIVLCVICLLLTIVNAAAGAYMALSG